jgi:hypothetical protein
VILVAEMRAGRRGHLRHRAALRDRAVSRSSWPTSRPEEDEHSLIVR